MEVKQDTAISNIRHLKHLRSNEVYCKNNIKVFYITNQRNFNGVLTAEQKQNYRELKNLWRAHFPFPQKTEDCVFLTELKHWRCLTGAEKSCPAKERSSPGATSQPYSLQACYIKLSSSMVMLFSQSCCITAELIVLNKVSFFTTPPKKIEKRKISG